MDKRFIFGVLLLLILPSASASLEDGIFAYWSFDVFGGDSKMPDLTGNDHNLTNNGVTLSGGLLVNGTLTSSSQYFDAGNIEEPIEGAYSNFTINFWVNFSSLTGEDTIMGTAATNTFSNGWAIRKENNNGNLLLRVANGASVIISCEGSNIGEADAWHMATLTKNGTNFTWYKDGTGVISCTDGDDITNGANLEIARSYNDPSGVDGQLDEMGIWNRTLSQTEIEELYNSGNGYNPFANPANFTITATDDYLSTSILNFSVIINGTAYQSNITSGEVITPYNATDERTFNITFLNATGYLQTENTAYNISDSGTSLEFTPLFNLSRHWITVFSAINTTFPVTNYSLVVDSGYYGNTTNGTMLFTSLWNTTENGTFYTSEFQNNYANQSFEINGSLNGNYTLYAYGQNSFYLTFYDEITGLNMSGSTVELELISDIYGNNYSTTNGTIYITALTPSDYIFRYSSDGYFTRTYYQTLVDGSYSVIDLYLLNETYANARNVTATVLSTLNEELEGATIIAQRYDTDTNSYITREQVDTNFEGKAELHLTNDEYYKFIIQYEGSTVLTTSPTYIYEDELTFIVDIGADPTEEYFNFQDITFTLVFNNATNKFELTYSDSNALASEICLYVYDTDVFGDTLHNSSCLSASSGSILVGVDVVNGTTYLAKAYATIGDTTSLIGSLAYTFFGESGFGNFGLLIVIILTVAFAFVGIWNPVVSLVITPIPILFGAIAGIVEISIAVAAGLELTFIIIAMAIGGRS